MGDLAQLAAEALGAAGAYAGGGISVAVKSNYTPEVTVYKGGLGGGGNSAGATSSGGVGGAISRLVGFKVGVVVRDDSGNTIASYGEEPPTDWVRVSIAAALLAALGYGLVKAVRAI